MSKPLVVYKASAGSGKTFTLATEYIKLLVENPLSYKQILAVTFTNKATDEMKMRILSQLYGIWRCLPSSDDYTRAVCKSLDISPAVASKMAGRALSYLLHNYNYFRVETIDSFFQSVLRNLARELDLTANLRVGLNDTQVEEQAVDQLIDDLRPTDKLLNWLMRYITDNISDDKSWNVIWQIKSFGEKIFSDIYKRNADRLRELSDPEKNFFDEYADSLRKLKAWRLNQVHDIAERFFKTVSGNNLTAADFLYGSTGVYGYFEKLSKGITEDKMFGKRVADAMSDSTKWAKKTSPNRAAVDSLAATELVPLLEEAEKLRPQLNRDVLSVDLTLRHLSQMRLLSSIENTVQDLNSVAGRFLLSDTQALLHGMMKDSDSPFVYEKIGARLEHIMIDEFQDTSSIQWLNFQVLLRETMSHSGSSNLIVGDVKQSIYRWRSGDWRLLNNMEDSAEKDVKSLSVNWRSARKIVEFNNQFFTLAASSEAERLRAEGIDGSQLTTAYSDVVQEVPAGKPDEGFIHMELLASDDYTNDTLERIRDRIQTLIDLGTDPGKICILVRSNHLIPIIAEYMMAEMPEVSLVSDEAFRLDASQAVNIIVLAMRFLLHSADKLSLATLEKLYRSVVLGEKDVEHQLLTTEDITSLLPPEYTQKRERLLAMPLYSMAESIFSIFKLEELKGQSAYTCAFFDKLSEYVDEHVADISDFLDEWDSNFCSETIQSDEGHGVRIISIHKSKGLEFDHVIMPFADWQMEKTRGVQIWCEPHEKPFSAMPLVAIDYSSKLKSSIYAADYQEEHLQNTVDNLNLLYVAFTRAARSLYVVGKLDARNSRSSILEKVLPLMTQGNLVQSDDSLTYDWGEDKPVVGKKEKKETDNVFKMQYEPCTVDVQNYELKAKFRQSNKSRDFVEGDTPRSAYIQTGTILHSIFSTIHTVDDIPQALRQLEQEGVLYSSEVKQEDIKARIRKALSNPVAREWFAPRWKLFNECGIICEDKKPGSLTTLRPDRVMTDGERMIVVDFKFGKQDSEHFTQVSRYMSLLRGMGYSNVSGYLWYVMTDRIEEVKD